MRIDLRVRGNQHRFLPGRRCVAMAVAAFVAALCVTGSVASALARERGPAGPESVHVKFRGDGDQGVLTTGPYAFLPSDGKPGAGRLIDDQTSNSWTVPDAPGCSPGEGANNVDGIALIGPGRMLGVCTNSSDYELYSIPAGPWRSLAPPSDCLDFGLGAGMNECDPVAVGRDWIQLAYSCYHCQTYYRYQDIATGIERSFTPAPDTLLDLSSPTLQQSICPPLTVPPRGSLTFDGSYAVAQTTDGAFLERCGNRRLHERLGKATYQLTYTTRLMLWIASETGTSATLAGVVLPTRRTFTIKLPSALALAGVHGLSITPRHIYIFSARIISANNYLNQLYVANLPKSLRTG